jgi:hypothetical protein
MPPTELPHRGLILIGPRKRRGHDSGDELGRWLVLVVGDVVAHHARTNRVATPGRPDTFVLGMEKGGRELTPSEATRLTRSMRYRAVCRS